MLPKSDVTYDYSSCLSNRSSCSAVLIDIHCQFIAGRRIAIYCSGATRYSFGAVPLLLDYYDYYFY